jgi:high frequency lysogenization protein
MREGRVIALAGLFQALALVRAVALRGSCDAAAMRTALASVLRIDAETPAAVYGGVANLRLGLTTLIAHLDAERGRDLALTRMAVSVLRLERSLAARPAVRESLRRALAEVAPRLAEVEAGTVDLAPRLARLYCENLSPLKPRVLVEGDPNYLTQSAQVDRIRALLLAAVRSAVLWRQLGGSQWRLLFRHRQYAMLARGLLARCTLDGG